MSLEEKDHKDKLLPPSCHIKPTGSTWVLLLSLASCKTQCFQVSIPDVIFWIPSSHSSLLEKPLCQPSFKMSAFMLVSWWQYPYIMCSIYKRHTILHERIIFFFLCESTFYHYDKRPEVINLWGRKNYIGSWFGGFSLWSVVCCFQIIGRLSNYGK